jgi:hypothetical protein
VIDRLDAGHGRRQFAALRPLIQLS